MYQEEEEEEAVAVAGGGKRWWRRVWSKLLSGTCNSSVQGWWAVRGVEKEEEKEEEEGNEVTAVAGFRQEQTL
jgi:hypothetical protein